MSRWLGVIALVITLALPVTAAAATKTVGFSTGLKTTASYLPQVWTYTTVKKWAYAQKFTVPAGFTNVQSITVRLKKINGSVARLYLVNDVAAGRTFLSGGAPIAETTINLNGGELYEWPLNVTLPAAGDYSIIVAIPDTTVRANYPALAWVEGNPNPWGRAPEDIGQPGRGQFVLDDVTTTPGKWAVKSHQNQFWHSVVLSSTSTTVNGTLTISVTPTAQTLTAGSTATATVSISGTGDYNGKSFILSSTLPALNPNLSISWGNTTVTAPGSTTLTLSARSTTPATTESYTITARSSSSAFTGNPVTSNTLSVTVSGGAPKITSINPVAAPAGALIELTGQGFGASKGTSQITFGSAAAAVTSWTDNRILATVPAGASGTATVTVGSQSVSVPFIATTARIDLAKAPAASTWPMARQNARRTGQATVAGPATTPNILWTQQIEPGVVGSPAIGPDGTLYFGSTSGKLYAINPASGAVVWIYTADSATAADRLSQKSMASSPAVANDGTVYIGGATGLHAVKNGVKQWVFPADGLLAAPVRSSPLIAADGTVIFGSDIGMVFRVNPDGSLHSMGVAPKTFDTGRSAALHDGAAPVLHLTTTATDMRLDPESPEIRGRYIRVSAIDIHSEKLTGLPATTPVVDPATGIAYFATSSETAGHGGGRIYAVRTSRHATNGYLSSPYITASAVAFTHLSLASSGTLYALTAAPDNKLIALTPPSNLDTGSFTQKWAYALTGPSLTAPVIDKNGTIYVISYEGTGDIRYLQAIDTHGSLKWKLAIDQTVTGSSPALGADGTLYFAAESGKVYAVGTTPAIAQVRLSPENSVLNLSGTQVFTATALDQYGNAPATQPSFTWSLSGGGTLSISGTKATFTAGATSSFSGKYTITATATGGLSGSAAISISPASTRMSITPKDSTVVAGGPIQFTANGSLAGGETVAPIASTWIVDGVTVATNVTTFSPTDLAPGSHTIAATSGSLTDSTTVTVTAPQIEITPERPEAVKGSYVTLSAWALDGRGRRAFKTSVTWTTSGGSLSATSGSTTDFRSTTAGSFTVTARLTAGGVTATDTAVVTVTNTDDTAADIEISAPATTMVINGELPLAAETVSSTGQFIGDAIVSWSLNGSGTISSASDSDVIFRPNAVGTHVITARMGTFSESITVTVTAGTLKILPENIKVAQGQNFTLFTYAADGNGRILGPMVGNWSIGEGGEAVIESADQLTLNAAGPVNTAVAHTIGAAAGSLTGSTGITIMNPDSTITSTQILPANQKLMVGHSIVLGAYGINKDGALVALQNDVTWSLEGTGATLSHTTGPLTQVTSTGMGTVTVKATRNGTTVSTTVVMSVGSLSVIKEDSTVTILDTTGMKLAAHDAAGNFSHLVSAESWTGGVTAKPLGTNGEDIDVLFTDRGSATITAAFGGQTASTTMTPTHNTLVIHPNDLKVETTGSLFLTLYSISEDGAIFAVTPDSWTVTNGSVVSGANSSTANVAPTGAAGGTMTVRATVGSQSATATITITAAMSSTSVHVIPRTCKVVRGREITFYAHKLGANGGAQGSASVTWILDGVTVATGATYTPSSTLALGSHTLEITSGSLASNSTTFTVVPAAVTVDPFVSRLPLGDTLTLQAWGWDGQGTRFALDNPGLLTWKYQGTGSISKTSGSTATTLTPTAISSQTVRAEILDHSALAFIDVQPKALRIDPQNHRFLNGQSATFRAYALNTAGQLAEPLYAESWGATGGGSVSQNAGDTINFTTNATAEAVILSRWKNFYATAPITVTEETSTTVTSLRISPSSESVAVGRSITLTLYGISENGNVIAPQSADRWEISGAGQLTQFSGATTTVEVTALGTMTITATKNNRTASTTLTGVVDQIRVLPSDNTTIQKDKTVTYSLYGVDANGNLLGKIAADSWTIPNGGGALSSASGTDTTLTASGSVSTTPYAIVATRGALTDQGRFTITAAGQTATDIAVLPKDPQVEVGQALTVTAYTANAATQTMIDPVSATWTVTGNATLSSSTGSSIVITPTASGTITVEATASGFSDKIMLTAKASQLTAASLQISPSTFSVPLDNQATVGLLALDSSGRLMGEVSADSWTVTSGSAQLSTSTGPRTTLTPTKTGSSFTLTATRGSLTAQSTFTVSASTAEAAASTTLAAIQVDPAGTVEIPAGTARQFRATGVNAASIALDKQPAIKWSTTGNNTITSNGVFTAGNTAGDFIVVASTEAASGLISGRTVATVTVKTPPLSHIVMTPAQAAVNAGESVTLTAEGRDTRENRMSNLTYIWTISGGGTVTADTADSRKATITASTPGRYTVTASAEGVQGSAVITIEPKAVTSADRVVSRLEITPSDSDILVGDTAAYQIRAYNAAGREVTGLSIPWSVQNDAIGQIDSQGTFVARAQGRTTIVVEIGAARATASVNVLSALSATQTVSRIVVDPHSATVNLGQSRTLSAVATAADDTVVSHPALSWSVTGGGTISQDGVFRATQPGMTTVKVTSGSAVGTAIITVPGEGLSEAAPSIEISPATTVVAAGSTATFTAIVRDGTGAKVTGKTITWSVNGGGSISSAGVFTAQTAGAYTVTATVGESTGTASLTITAAAGSGEIKDIVIANPVNADCGVTTTMIAIPLDNSGQPIPGLQTLEWALSGGGEIQKSTGVIEPKIPGDYTVSVRTPTGVSASAPITILPKPNSGRVTQIVITPSETDITAGETALFTAAAYDENGKTINGVAVTWSVSGSGAIASSGLYTAPSSGGPYTVNVLATFGDIVETYPMTVRATNATVGAVTHIDIPNNSLTVKNGQSVTLQAVPKDAEGQTVAQAPVTWSVTGGGTIASNGTFTASTPGLYEVVATSGSVKSSAVVSVPGSAPQGTPSYVEVSAPDPVVQVGETVALTAAVKTPQGQPLSNETVSWSAGSGTINSQGNFTATTPGITTVTATNGSVIGTSTIHVVAAGSSEKAPAHLVISDGPHVMTMGNELALTAAVLDENKKEIDSTAISWSAPRGGSITDEGVFSASEPGTYSIRASAGAVTQTVNITVAAPAGAGEPTHLVIHQSPEALVEGSRIQFSATPMDANNNPIAQSIKWEAPAGGGSIDNTGLFVPTQAGAFVITAKAGDVTQAVPVSVAAAGAPPVRSAAVGNASQIEVAPHHVEVAVGQPITLPAVVKDTSHFVIGDASVKWSATGGGSINSNGTFTPTTAGTYTVTASSGSAVGSATVNVVSSAATASNVSTLTMPVREVSVLLGKTISLAALAQDKNGRVISNAPVTYAVSGGGTITSSGVFTATQSGTYVIKATSGAITTTSVLHVVVDDQAPVVKISLNNHTLKKGTFISRKPKMTILITDETGIDTGSLKIYVGGKKLSAQSLQTQVIKTQEDNPTSLQVTTQLTDSDALEEGKHNLRVEVSDTSGNAAAATTQELVVQSGDPVLLAAPINYPNPFSPSKGQSTFINYTLNVDTDVVAYIYDITGTMIWKRTFAAGTKGGTAGETEIEWNGRTDFGEFASNGAYIYFLTTPQGKVLGKGSMAVFQ